MGATPRGWLSWLERLARGVGSAHTDPSLALAIRRSSDQIAWVEVGRSDASGTPTEAVRTHGDDVRVWSVGGARTIGAETLRSGSQVRVRQEPMLAMKLGSAAYALVAIRDARTCPVEVLRVAEAIVGGAVAQIDVLGRLADRSRWAHQEGNRLRDALDAVLLPDGVIAESESTRELYATLIPMVARHGGAVLIRGESGTGKERVAREIHRRSSRGSRALLTVNCGAIPVTLIESTLFGHERGAFTGAQSRQPGLFERADGGTLFLDEVAELSRPAQVRLLRVLQEGELERVGGRETIRVDVRVVAATHRPLEAWVKSGKFRRDLYYRLDVLPVTVRPLRERPEDLIAIVTQRVAHACDRLGRPVLEIASGTLERLRGHDWPGNVRELENVIERSVLFSRGPFLELAADFGPSRTRAEPKSRAERLDVSIRRSIEAALERTEGRLYGPDGAAAVLGLKPTTLQSKMKKLGIARR